MSDSEFTIFNRKYECSETDWSYQIIQIEVRSMQIIKKNMCLHIKITPKTPLKIKNH